MDAYCNSSCHRISTKWLVADAGPSSLIPQVPKCVCLSAQKHTAQTSTSSQTPTTSPSRKQTAGTPSPGVAPHQGACQTASHPAKTAPSPMMLAQTQAASFLDSPALETHIHVQASLQKGQAAKVIWLKPRDANLTRRTSTLSANTVAYAAQALPCQKSYPSLYTAEAAQAASR